MRIFLLSFALPICGWAAQSLNLGTGTPVNAGSSIPNSSPYTTARTGSFRIEFGFSTFTAPGVGTCANITSLLGLLLQLCSSSGGNCGGVGSLGAVSVNDSVDTMPGNSYACVPVPAAISGNKHFRGRIQRNDSAKQIFIEIWSANGTGYSVAENDVTTINGVSLPYTNVFGADTATTFIDFIRWYSTLVPVGNYVVPSTPPANVVTSFADLGDWEFEGNGNDSSGNGLNYTFTSPSYGTTPTHAPFCIVPQTAFKTGVSTTLGASCFSNIDNQTLTCLWTQDSSTSNSVSFSAASTCGSNVTVSNRGAFNSNVVVTDATPTSAVALVTHSGGVTVDANDVVQNPASYWDTLVGATQLRWGSPNNPWVGFDDRQKYILDYFANLEATDPDWMDNWSTPLTGTVDITNASNAVVGHGTAFLSIPGLCAGDGWLIDFYTVSPGVHGKWPLSVASCADDTHLTLAGNNAPTETVQFSKWNGAQYQIWAGNASNINFYDSALAFYSLYARTGFDYILTAARSLAANWYTQPFVDKFRTCGLLGIHVCMFPRNKAATGLALYSLEAGVPQVLVDMEQWWTADEYYVGALQANAPLTDLREQAALYSELSLSQFSSNGAARVSAQTALVAQLNGTWTNQQYSGAWNSATYGNLTTWNGAPGTIAVANGGTIVTGSGTNFQSVLFGAGQGYLAWFKRSNCTTPPTSNTADGGDGDTVYAATYVSPTRFDLSSAGGSYPATYQGANIVSGGCYQISNVVGFGILPYTQGYAIHAMSNARNSFLAAGDTTSAATAASLINTAGVWLRDNSIWNGSFAPFSWTDNMGNPHTITASNGFYYARNAPGCGISPTTLRSCNGIDTDRNLSYNVQSTRVLDLEAFRAWSEAYLLTHDATIKANADLLFGAAFGSLGGPSSDAYFVQDKYGFYGSAGEVVQLNEAKYVGFFGGWGGMATWLGARIQSSTPSSSVILTGTTKMLGPVSVLQ